MRQEHEGGDMKQSLAVLM